jgi:ER-bound oxygenase mpaB/B'/Rubber oxygenase, catalytic domain
MASRWTDEMLEAARFEGDKDIDPLVADVLRHVPGSSGVGRLGYNHMVDLADVLVVSPELVLAASSLLSQQLAAMSQRNPRIGGFFDPVEAPAWVDEHKLQVASHLWETDSILILAVLYAASLPYCYLMKRGVPALYQTEKLADHRYVFQRIFETGTMLEAVMHPQGIRVVADMDPHTDQRMVDVLNKLDPGGGWKWVGHTLQRSAGTGAAVDVNRVRREFDAMQGPPKRYLWGPGVVVTKKVRFLHASMRFMLLNPQDVRPIGDATAAAPPRSMAEALSRRTAPWDVDGLGVPVNQEDLAFVLLTFGYAIPRGMIKWGRHVNRLEREAFLHLWKVVGHVLGLREDLMTDDPDDAAALFEQILRRNRGATEASVILTGAVMDFVRGYLPSRFGINKEAPAALIMEQLGPDDARLIVPPANYAAARRFWPRVRHGTVRTILVGYYVLRDQVFRHIPVLAGALVGATSEASAVLIASWRDSYRRRPFYVPANATTWVRQRGVTPQYEHALADWRQGLFDRVFAALALLFLGMFSLGAAIVCAIVWRGMPLAVTAGLFLVGTVSAVGIMRYSLKAFARHRPRLDGAPAVQGATAASAPEPAGTV